MGLKLNLIFSIGALLPFFLGFIMISAVLLDRISWISIFFLGISLFINSYLVVYIRIQKKFIPRIFKVKSIDAFSDLSMTLAVLSLLIPLIILPLSIRGLFHIDTWEIVLFFSLLIIILFTVLVGERSLSMILFVRILFRRTYIVETNSGSKIYVISRDKIQVNTNIKLYQIVEDVYLFGYRHVN